MAPNSGYDWRRKGEHVSPRAMPHRGDMLPRQAAVAELQRVQALTASLERAFGGVRTREERARWIV